MEYPLRPSGGSSRRGSTGLAKWQICTATPCTKATCPTRRTLSQRYWPKSYCRAYGGNEAHHFVLYLTQNLGATTAWTGEGPFTFSSWTYEKLLTVSCRRVAVRGESRARQGCGCSWYSVKNCSYKLTGGTSPSTNLTECGKDHLPPPFCSRDSWGKQLDPSFCARRIAPTFYHAAAVFTWMTRTLQSQVDQVEEALAAEG